MFLKLILPKDLFIINMQCQPPYKASKHVKVKESHATKTTDGKVVFTQNGNSININFPPETHDKLNNNSQAIIIKPEPFKLAIDTPTDWPSVFASSAVAFSVGLMAFWGQRAQIKAEKAKFRHEWQAELRTALSDFIGVSSKILYAIKDKGDFLSNPESNEIYSDFLKLQAKILIMLDVKKDYAQKISSLIDKITKEIKNNPIDDNKLNGHVNDLLLEGNILLEKTWQDMQDDLDQGFFSEKLAKLVRRK